MAFKKHRSPSQNRGTLLKQFIAFPILFFCLHCTAKGPVIAELETQKPALLTGSYRFTPGQSYFRHSQLGQLSFKQIYKRGVNEHIKTNFSLEILGQLASGSVRIRNYQGVAIIHSGILELQAERCYLFGKKFWEDKRKPITRFDCDHLVFHFQSPSGFQKRDALIQIQSRRTRFSDWLEMKEIQPLPGHDLGTAFFAGQVLELKDSVTQNFNIQTPDGVKKAPLDNHIRSRIEKADLIVWGPDAGLLLRKKQELIALDKHGQKIATIEVISRPGDTILGRWKQKPKTKAVSAYTKTDARAGIDLF